METPENDATAELVERVEAAAAQSTPLAIIGGGSKRFIGRATNAAELGVGEHRGITGYEPTELVITCRAGTPLQTVETVLREQGQMLAFEPPHFGDTATLGGTIACGLSGPRRPYAGAARDFVLGVKIINGEAGVLSFGGQVMKNVAGYDVSRLMAGAMGTLGVLLEVSLKVLPRPEHSQTQVRKCDQAKAIALMNEWAGRPLPLSGACHVDGSLYVRLSGTSGGVRAAAERIGGDSLADSDAFWHRLREHHLPFFVSDKPLWRVSLPPASPLLALEHRSVVDWGGALRWMQSEASADDIRHAAAAAGGHAILFRHGDHSGEVYHPLGSGLLKLHERLKTAFDPHGLFNVGRMYAGL